MVPTKKRTTTFDSTRLLFDMWVRHHECLISLLVIKKPSLWKASKNIVLEGGDEILTQHFTHNWMAK
jgi:hypothetical protein